MPSELWEHTLTCPHLVMTIDPLVFFLINDVHVGAQISRADDPPRTTVYYIKSSCSPAERFKVQNAKGLLYLHRNILYAHDL